MGKAPLVGMNSDAVILYLMQAAGNQENVSGRQQEPADIVLGELVGGPAAALDRGGRY
ncbi:hypothetical protein [Trichlorobacter lovleyi]|uniref:hypothetical protein n=1 Tax=Trichlorobacter lovleyi TaxID=313985 RepID=UPI00248058BA|nr:hypothetical protein [Trichlorobacter lovleyi]